VVDQYGAWAKSITWVKQTGSWSAAIDPKKDLGERPNDRTKKPTPSDPIRKARAVLLRAFQLLTPEGASASFESPGDVNATSDTELDAINEQNGFIEWISDFPICIDFFIVWLHRPI
jgi:hypothetical protein